METGLHAPLHKGTEQRDMMSVLVSGAARRGLGVPALLLLEVAAPFRLLIQQALLFAQPLLAPWAGERLSAWAGLLEDGDALDEARRRLAMGVGQGGR